MSPLGDNLKRSLLLWPLYAHASFRRLSVKLLPRLSRDREPSRPVSRDGGVKRERTEQSGPDRHDRARRSESVAEQSSPCRSLSFVKEGSQIERDTDTKLRSFMTADQLRETARRVDLISLPV